MIFFFRKVFKNLKINKYSDPLITIEYERRYVEKYLHPETFQGTINLEYMNHSPNEEFDDGVIHRYNNE